MVITSHFLTKFLLSVGRVSSLGWLGLGIKENSVQWTGGKFKDKEGLPGRRGWYWFLFRHDAKNKKAKKGVLFLCIKHTQYLSVRSKCNKIFSKTFWTTNLQNLISMKISASSVLLISVFIIFIRSHDTGSLFYCWTKLKWMKIISIKIFWSKWTYL